MLQKMTKERRIRFYQRGVQMNMAIAYFLKGSFLNRIQPSDKKIMKELLKVHVRQARYDNWSLLAAKRESDES